MKTISYITLLFLFTVLTLNAQEHWELIKDKDGIQVYLEEEGTYAFKTFKGTTTIEASIHDFIDTIFDLNSYEDWGHNVKPASLQDSSTSNAREPYTFPNSPRRSSVFDINSCISFSIGTGSADGQ